jgi:hypothetical protein
MRDRTESAPDLESRTEQKRSELAHKIASLMGSKEKWVTDVPGLTLVRRTKVVGAGCGTYEPSIAVIAQGRKEVELGKRTVHLRRVQVPADVRGPTHRKPTARSQ